jgi:solute carrier family 25 oxoglutarate transporter 11
MKKDPVTGLMPYKNIGDCFVKTIQREGVFGLWVGLPVFYTRVGPHAMITLLV